MEWTGSSSGFPLEAKWAKIQPMRVSGVTVTPAAVKLIPGETINFTARVTVLTPMGVDPLNVTTGAAWTVTGGKGYSMADGRLTVKANETAQALTVTAKYGTDSGSATVEVDQAVSPEQLTGIEQIGGTLTSNSDGAVGSPPAPKSPSRAGREPPFLPRAALWAGTAPMRTTCPPGPPSGATP